LVEKALAHGNRGYVTATGRIMHEALAKERATSDILHSAYFGDGVQGGRRSRLPPNAAAESRLSLG
jgi:hypothetical protein